MGRTLLGNVRGKTNVIEATDSSGQTLRVKVDADTFSVRVESQQLNQEAILDIANIGLNDDKTLVTRSDLEDISANVTIATDSVAKGYLGY